MDDEREWLAERFTAHGAHLRAVAYRMLGSLAEAEDAVQEAWLRISRADTSDVVNMGGWLTTVVGRVCLDMLRSRASRREQPLDGPLPEPIVSPENGLDPEQQALIADSVGLAMLVVLETLAPAERLAFVLHDMFAVPFEDIAPIVGRNAAATRQLASRARRRVRGSAPVPDADLAKQRAAVDAFLAAARDGDFEALVAVLDPDVVLHADIGTGTRMVRGAREVASQAMLFRGATGAVTRPVLVNGAAGMVAYRNGKVQSVGGVTVVNGLIVEIDILADPKRLSQLDLGPWD
ncbi:MAG TPA: sigma-70 family RNA polymerase sigma factor [Pseudonocardiaceae bacterium]|nr:sigma-70 family RNA polymerase sigma factor [Pseudonocardiaceae bacterium]